MTSFARLFAVTVALLAAAPALAADFSGRWLLDEAASGSMDPILDLQGVGWAQRKLAEGLDAKVTITQTAETLTATYENLAGDPTQVLHFDGKPHESVNPAGLPVTFSARWTQGDAVLVASGPATTEDGAAGTLTETRSLSADGRTMTIRIEVVAPGGRKATTTRVFRRRG